jgi:hypothetical protein
MESRCIIVNPINETHTIVEVTDHIEQPIESNNCTHIGTCICFMGCLFMFFLLLGGYNLLAVDSRNDPV